MILNSQSVQSRSFILPANYALIQVEEELYQIKNKMKDYIKYHHLVSPNDTPEALQELVRTLTSQYGTQNSVDELKRQLQQGKNDIGFQNSIIQLHKDFKSSLVFLIYIRIY